MLTLLFQISNHQRILLLSFIPKLRVIFIHFANLPARPARNVLVEIIRSDLHVTRLCTHDFASFAEPLRPREPLASSHDGRRGRE
jgi:hypothetical protein